MVHETQKEALPDDPRYFEGLHQDREGQEKTTEIENQNIMSWNSTDGAAPRNSELMDCADCDNKVTCEDEREEFNYAYLCNECYELRKENLELEDETQLFL